MARAKFQTLTEQMFYTLLCLKEECYGMDILDKVPAMTNHRVNVGSGTLYTLLEQFQDAEMIRETKVEGRRRSYILTDKGREMLEKECARLTAQLADYHLIFGEEDAKCKTQRNGWKYSLFMTMPESADTWRRWLRKDG